MGSRIRPRDVHSDPDRADPSAATTRYLLYSHDTYGLGHLRRTILLADGLVTASPNAEVLIVTGSPQTQSFDLPERVDSLKLPTATKDPRGNYVPRKLTSGIDNLVEFRASLIRTAAMSFEPDVVLVDHAPVGMRGELLPTLDYLDALPRSPRLVLGLRDIVDDARRVEVDWSATGVWEQLQRYDEVLVYGDPRIETTAMELGLADRVGGVVTHTGYIAPTMPDPVPQDPYLLVTVGGGGDGQQLLRSFLTAAELGATRGVASVIVGGPLLSTSRRLAIAAVSRRLPGVKFVDFSSNLRELMASATGVISMAGYNTVVEEMVSGRPSLLVPRTRPRREQEVRADRLSQVPDSPFRRVRQLNTRSVSQFTRHCLAGPARPIGLDVGGVGRACARLVAIGERELCHG